MQIPICSFYNERFVDIGDEVDDDVPLCSNCTGAVMAGQV
jgi:hypothetical protein